MRWSSSLRARCATLACATRAAATRLARSSEGGVSVIGAFALSGLMAVSALSVDINRGLSQRVRNQSIADMAALGAAIAYQASGQNSATLTPTAQDIARANGLIGATVNATVVANMPTNGAQAVKVTVTSTLPVALGKALGITRTYSVGATSYASLATAQAGTKACFLALASSGTGISTSGGATINTPNCAVAAVANVYNGGTGITADKIVSGTGEVGNNYGSLTANSINYATNFTNPSWNGNVPAANKITKQSTTLTDPLADSSDLAAARAQLGTYTAPTAPTNPTTPTGQNWALDWSPNGTVSSYWNSSTATYTIPQGSYAIKSLSVGGGIKVVFQGASTITISAGFSNGGSGVNFGDATLSVNGGFDTGSSGITMGNGALTIGSGTVNFNGTNVIGNGPVSINAALNLGGGSNLTMGTGNHRFQSISVGGGAWLKMGNGDLDVVSGISVGGGSTVAAGAGSYRLGKNGSGDAINLSGSGVMIMGDGAFSANGNIRTEGGSRLVFGKTTNHYINGNMAIAGSVLFGTSRYTVNGNFNNGTGGTTWPFTSSVTGLTYGNTLEGTSVSGYDMAGINVSFILSGTMSLGGGAKTILVANSASVSGGAIADVLLSSLTTSDTNWGQGANSLLVGAVHLPNSAITMSGGNATLSGGQCFMLIGKTINATGGATAGSACNSINAATGGGAGATSVTLLQ